MIRDTPQKASRPAEKAPRPGIVGTPARVHPSALRGIPIVLERLGVPCEPILAAVNLKREDLDDPDRSAAFSDMDHLIGLCVRRTHAPIARPRRHGLAADLSRMV